MFFKENNVKISGMALIVQAKSTVIILAFILLAIKAPSIIPTSMQRTFF
ncbi:hypothetical protein LACWKB8_1470 [Lactobacillus sp. wkB8]|nr:hypothetical protein LACWKB8_1470 [Lactobacillus sp. wkB8]